MTFFIDKIKNKISKSIRSINRHKHNKQYSYGYVINGKGRKTRARINNKTGKVEFVLWKAGKQGHKNNYWHEFGYGWITLFFSDHSMRKLNDSTKCG